VFNITAPSILFMNAGQRLMQAVVSAVTLKLKSPVAAPRVDTSPVQEEEIDGHRIFKPVGDKLAIGHLLHFHGFGGLSKNEIEFLYRLAAGKIQGEAVIVVAPIAQNLVSKEKTRVTLQAFYSLACFIRQQPPDVQLLIKRNIFDNKTFLETVCKLTQAVRNPPWWFPFIFEPKTNTDGALSADIHLGGTELSLFGASKVGQSECRLLRPNRDETIKLMFRTAEEIAPRIDAALERVGAVTPHICVSGFSQGVGPAIIHSAILRPGVFCQLVSICASHIKTPKTPAVKDLELKIDVILPRGDCVLATIGFRDARTRRDLEADFHGRLRIWEPLGRHAIEGHVAHIASMQIVNSLRHSHRM
jgi:hypothetical protein